ncbi:uncharacterized protein LOC141914822 [Tubulanus polymorphus]|uniref:uncharacterized protein LOC141914822 n=1 Tax=Tubulanus polymorphus TaxID=672921 RepID=UPI003DA6280E
MMMDILKKEKFVKKEELIERSPSNYHVMECLNVSCKWLIHPGCVGLEEKDCHLIRTYTCPIHIVETKLSAYNQVKEEVRLSITSACIICFSKSSSRMSDSIVCMICSQKLNKLIDDENDVDDSRMIPLSYLYRSNGKVLLELRYDIEKMFSLPSILQEENILSDNAYGAGVVENNVSCVVQLIAESLFVKFTVHPIMVYSYSQMEVPFMAPIHLVSKILQKRLSSSSVRARIRIHIIRSLVARYFGISDNQAHEVCAATLGKNTAERYNRLANFKIENYNIRPLKS